MLEYSYVYIALTVRSTPTVRIHIPWLAHKLPEPSSSPPNRVAYPHHPGAADSFPEIPGSSLSLLSERLQKSGMAILGAHSDDLMKSGRGWQPGDRLVLCGVSGKAGDTDHWGGTDEGKYDGEKEQGYGDVEAASRASTTTQI